LDRSTKMGKETEECESLGKEVTSEKRGVGGGGLGELTDD